MKKNLLIILFITTLIFSFSNNAEAITAGTDMGEINLSFGLNANHYPNLTNQIAEKYDLSEPSYSWGYYFNVKQWIGEETYLGFIKDNLPWALGNLAIGFEHDYLSVDFGDDEEIRVDNASYLLNFAYRLSALSSFFPEDLLLNYYWGFHQARFVRDGEAKLENDENIWSGKVGLEFNRDLFDLWVIEDLALNTRLNYRFINHDQHSNPEVELDFSGFEASLGINMTF